MFTFIRALSISFAALLLMSQTTYAAIQSYRWTNDTQVTDDLGAILTKLSEQSGLQLRADQFQLVEEKPLATSMFKTYAQMSHGVPVKGALIRTWAKASDRKLIQMEATIDDGAFNNMRTRILARNSLSVSPMSLRTQLSRLDNMTYVRQVVAKHRDDNVIGMVKSHDEWRNTSLVRVIEVTGKHGVHTILVSQLTKKIIESSYKEHPQFDMQAEVFEIYEETEKGLRQETVPVKLSHLSAQRRETTTDPYLPLREYRYLENKIDYVRGETEDGRAQGYWSPTWLLRTAKGLFDALPSVDNSFTNGVYLEGDFATINLHPDVVSKVTGIDFAPTSSGRLSLLWKPTTVDGSEVYELFPVGAYHGRPMMNSGSAAKRQPIRHPQHDVATYINNGFDEVQVYYAINRLMLSLQAMGFSDVDLSTRPFHAYLYDPDVSMRDNAYYTNDTINFTTYSPGAQNFARDNSTIWHELGHGVMDRLMGDMITLADSGGLAEGMADFVAQLVIHDVKNSQSFPGSDDFRIINNTGFNLTNESHDDGEAYGGAMNDILLRAVAVSGHEGLVKVADLTLEAMRLARNHPALTANDWFEHMLYADQLGHDGVRAPGELTMIITQALSTRNFRLDRGQVAQYSVKNGTEELTDESMGSRYRPISVTLAAGQEASFNLTMQAIPSEFYQFRYPVRISVGLNGGPLQGALKWKNEVQAPFEYTLNKPEDLAAVTLAVTPGCDFVNREDGSCSDYAYIQVYHAGDAKPFAKKRFYVRVVSPGFGQ